MRPVLTRLLAFWPLLLALGWFASTARMAGHFHAVHEKAPHLDNAAGDWGGDCDLCRGAIATAARPSPADAPLTPPAPRFAALPAARAALRALATRYPPLSARPPPVVS